MKRARLLLAPLIMVLASPASADQGAPITSARVCAALAVYSMGTAPEWDQRAARAEQVLDVANARGQVADCGAGVRQALSTDFDPLRWQVSLALVDATADASDSFPDACPSVAPRQSPAEGQRLFSAGGAW
jgi:hypothetical protein